MFQQSCRRSPDKVIIYRTVRYVVQFKRKKGGAFSRRALSVFQLFLILRDVYYPIGVSIVLINDTSFRWRESTKIKILIGFLIYGVIVGSLTAWWWHISDNVFLPNIAGALFGDAVYEYSINFLGDPHSAQAHYTIPWILRLPQVYVPVSIVFWGLSGLVIQLAHNAHQIKRMAK